MQDNELNNLLDLVYEIEGLAELALKRENPPKTIEALIKDKVKQLCEIVDDTATDEEKTNSRSVKPDDVAVAPPVANDAEEVDDDEFEYGVERDEEFYDDNDTYDDTDNSVSFPKVSRGKVDFKSLFSINDKFRFRRELFSNNGNEFSDALHLVATMDSMDEAEDYFYNDLQWDPESDDVMDFMGKIAQYFGQ